MDIFPTNIAVGRAFCNRVEERVLLKQYVKNGAHTVIMAPRRYGKSSLINQTLLELKLPFCIIEFTMVVTPEDAQQIILKKIGDLLYSILPRSTKAKQSILKIFNFLRPEIVLTAGGQTIVFRPRFDKRMVAHDISEALKMLDKAAIKAKKKIVVVMDEFQEISAFQDHTIEASIRAAMQYSKQVSYIFSGSNRHMIRGMFNNKNRPFYNSCELMTLNRISIEDYEPFIQKAAQLKWKKRFKQVSLNNIFELSELHPSYVNRICGHFWITNVFPTPEKIKAFWKNFIESKQSDFTKEFLDLSKNQRKLLRYLALKPTRHPSSQEVCHETKMSEASIRQALAKLMNGDYVYKNKQNIINILDPAFKMFILQKVVLH